MQLDDATLNTEGEYNATPLDSMTKRMCLLSNKAFKPILVVAQNTIMNLKISIMLCKCDCCR